MFKRAVAYTHDGDTFVGQYKLVGFGDAEAVSVHFDGKSASTGLGAADPDTIARTLLQRLVLERLAQETDHHSAVAA
jgi:hypothetical protein